VWQDEAKADLARLKAIRAKREADKAAREAREAEAADGDKKKEKKEKVDKSAKVVLETPTQKEVKSALTKIKDCANEDWQEKHKLDKLSGNKLAKMKYKVAVFCYQICVHKIEPTPQLMLTSLGFAGFLGYLGGLDRELQQ
jgi:hypothetical protein